MNKTELIEVLASKANVSKRDAENVLNALVDSVAQTLANDGEVDIKGFGKFKNTQRKERMGRNPKTGESLKIEASKVPVFKASKSFKLDIIYYNY